MVFPTHTVAAIIKRKITAMWMSDSLERNWRQFAYANKYPQQTSLKSYVNKCSSEKAIKHIVRFVV